MSQQERDLLLDELLFEKEELENWIQENKTHIFEDFESSELRNLYSIERRIIEINSQINQLRNI